MRNRHRRLGIDDRPDVLRRRVGPVRNVAPRRADERLTLRVIRMPRHELRQVPHGAEERGQQSADALCAVTSLEISNGRI
jgi:hypothetical protein